MTEIEKRFEKSGGFERALKDFKGSQQYKEAQAVVKNRAKELSDVCFGARGVVAALAAKTPADAVNGNYSYTFRYFGGVCHAASRVNEAGCERKDQTVMFSFPVPPSVEEYPEGFLDSFYTWLTTESPAKDVFFEPWNGEFLSVNLSKPANLVLFALILSRLPSESLHARKIWVRAIKKGFSWWDTVLFLGQVSDDDYEAGFLLSSRGSGAHSVSPITYLEEPQLPALVNHKLEYAKGEAKFTANWNGEGSAAGGVWAMYNNGQYINCSVRNPYKELAEKVRTELGFRPERDHWGHITYRMTKPTCSKGGAKNMDIVLDAVKEFLDKYREVAA